jgi:hypothetical protein
VCCRLAYWSREPPCGICSGYGCRPRRRSRAILVRSRAVRRNGAEDVTCAAGSRRSKAASRGFPRSVNHADGMIAAAPLCGKSRQPSGDRFPGNDAKE